jgi:ribosomal protein S18
MISPSDFSASKLYTTTLPPLPKPPLLSPAPRLVKLSDPFYQTNTNPLDYTFNPLFSYAMLNDLGRIKPRSETGLTIKNQKRATKMVKRARGMGLISGFVNRASVGGLGSLGSRGGRY